MKQTLHFIKIIASTREEVFRCTVKGGVLPAFCDVGHVEDGGAGSFILLTLLPPGDAAGWVPTQEETLLPVRQPQGPVGLEPVDAEAVPAQSGGQAVLVVRVSPVWQKGPFYYQRLGRVLDGDGGRAMLVDDRAILGLVSVTAEAEVLFLAAAGSHPCIAQMHRDAGSARGVATPDKHRTPVAAIVHGTPGSLPQPSQPHPGWGV